MKQRQLNTFLDTLNREQKEAVTGVSGPHLVIAGAGTGKTEVITKRIAYLVESKIAAPSEILALTFTDKAASEMLERVDSMSSYIYPDFLVTTFHSFGEQVLRSHGIDIGLTSEYKVLSQAEQLLFLRDNVFKLNLDYYLPKSDPTSFLYDLSRLFSRAKDELISGEDFVEFAKKMTRNAKTPEEKEEAKKTSEVANAYKIYNDLLIEAGYVDYGDLIILPYKIFLEHPTILKKWQDRIKYFLIDEFQDTNYAQYELIKLLSGKSQNITVVADDDQAIYRFRGAASYNVLTFLKDFPKAIITTLFTNYRSTQSILDHSHKLISNNNPYRLEEIMKINKSLVSSSDKGLAPGLMLYESESAEADAVAEKIVELNKSGIPFEEIAILVRANNHVEAFNRALSRHKIPFVFSGASGLYHKQEIKLAISFFEVIADPKHDFSLYHLLTSEVYNIDSEQLSILLHSAKRKNISLLSELKETAQFSKIVEDLNTYREFARTQSAGQLLNTFLNRSGYLKRLVEEQDKGDIESANKIIAISNFFDRIIDFQRSYSDHSLQKFVEFIRLMLQVGEDPKAFELDNAIEAVKVLTVHRAKGLEFRVVFVSSLADDHFPTKNRGEDRISLPNGLLKEEEPPENEHYLEERRLFYVALTRAKEQLYLTAALDYGTKRTHKLSRFVLETMGDVHISEAFTKTRAIEKLKHFEVQDEGTAIEFAKTPKDKKLTVTRAKIDDYNTCPLKYKFLHVVPIKVLPDQGVAYGNTIHNTVEEFFKRRLEDRKITLADLLNIYKEKWENAGFLSAEHEEARFSQGKVALTNFFKRYIDRPLPISVEEKFKFVLNDAVVEGRIDIIEKIGDKIRIVDFKTSDTVKDKEGADRRTKQSSQLKIYAYAYKKESGVLPDEVSLYFIDSGIEGVYIPTEKDMDDVEATMTDAIAGIRNANFVQTPSQKACGYCPFRFYCPYAILPKIAS